MAKDQALSCRLQILQVKSSDKSQSQSTNIKVIEIRADILGKVSNKRMKIRLYSTHLLNQPKRPLSALKSIYYILVLRDVYTCNCGREGNEK
jgi:hypothetical protein